MGPRWRYLFSEVTTGLRRNLLMTLATVVTVTVSLVVLGAGGLAYFQVEKAKDVLYADVEVSIFLNDDISQDQTESMLADLEGNPVVANVIYESKQGAYENARRLFENDPELVAALRPDSLPASFRVQLVDPEQFETIKSQFEGYPGVDEVVDYRDILLPFFTIMNQVVRAALGVAFLQLLAAAALISNTIRLTAFARREQTGIMKLVGATNWYIRLPFMLEGIFAGFLGAVLAGVLIVGTDITLVSRIKREIAVIPFLTTGEVASIIPLMILVGMVVAALASFFSLRRFLDV